MNEKTVVRCGRYLKSVRMLHRTSVAHYYCVFGLFYCSFFQRVQSQLSVFIVKKTVICDIWFGLNDL